jgi:hypothetical protein
VSPAAPVDQLVIFVPRRNGDALLGFEAPPELGDELTAQSRASDPSTSHAAGAEQVKSGRAAAHAWIVLSVLKSASEPLTYREVHKRCVDRIAEAAEVQKRLDSLRTAGLAATAPKRECTVTLREVQTWRAK